MTREERTGWLEEIQDMVTVPSLEANFADECRAIAISDAIVIVDKYEQLLADVKQMVNDLHRKRIDSRYGCERYVRLDYTEMANRECGREEAYEICESRLRELVKKYD